MPIEIEDARCKGHALCVDACPSHAIALVNGKGTVVSPDDCSDCEACITICPEHAIVAKKRGLVIIGEKINGSLKRVEEAIAKRDAGLIQALAIRQSKGGADYIDVNAGTQGAKEVEDMMWLVSTIQEATETPLSIDTTNPQVLQAVLPCVKHAPLINSCNADERRLDATLPLVKQYDCKLVALMMGPKNKPEPLPKRLEYAEKIIGYVRQAEIPTNRVFFDPIIMPVSVDNKTSLHYFDCIKALKAAYPNTKSICGLSNVSFAMPKRKFLNQTFVVAALANGMDAAILDVLDRRMMLQILAAQALLNMDPNVAVYKKIFGAMK